MAQPKETFLDGIDYSSEEEDTSGGPSEEQIKTDLVDELIGVYPNIAKAELTLIVEECYPDINELLEMLDGYKDVSSGEEEEQQQPEKETKMPDLHFTDVGLEYGQGEEATAQKPYVEIQDTEIKPAYIPTLKTH
jgi:hypothetical protein